MSLETPAISASYTPSPYPSLALYRAMAYDPIPLVIPVLATGYVLAIYLLLRLVQRGI